MKKSTQNEKYIEELLKSMPSIKDQQKQEDLYEKIQSKMIDSEQNSRNNIRTKRWVPALVGVAAIVLILVVMPSMFMQSDLQDRSMNEESASLESKEGKLEMSLAPKQDNDNQNQNSLSSNNHNPSINGNEKMLKMIPVSHVLSEVPKGQQLVTVALPDKDGQNVIPFSTTIGLNDDAFNYMNKMISSIPLEQYNLIPFSLDSYELKTNLETVIINVPKNHQHGIGSTSEVMFLQTIKETFKRMGYDKVKFFTSGTPGIELGNYGVVYEVHLDEPNGYFLYQPSANMPPLLVPYSVGGNEDNLTVEDVLSRMKVEVKTHNLLPSIPEKISFKKITSDGDRLSISLEDSVTLLNHEESILFIEAILLTAADFGFESVKIDNSKTERIGQYLLAEEISVPVGPNPIR